MNLFFDSAEAIRRLKKVSDLRDFYYELAKCEFQNSEFKNAAKIYMKKLKKEIDEFIRINQHHS